MCFGRLISKWRILKAPLCVKVKNATRIIYCCTRLHNFSIKEGDVVPELNPEDQKEFPAENYVQCTQGLQGQSHMRYLVQERVNSKGLSRPLHNLFRNNY